jgi:glycosyltransferase involved in cell wall biosynthesis
VFDHFLKYCTGLGGGLLELGSPVAMLGRMHDTEFGGEPEAARAWVGRELGPGVPFERLPGRVRDPATLAASYRARRFVRRFSPDAVHLQDSVVNDVRLIAASGVPRRAFALTVHDPTPRDGNTVRSPRKWRLRSALIRHARVVFVHAEALREELLAIERPRGAVVVVPHGIESPAPMPLPRTPSLLFFGRLSYYKGLDTLLEAMPAVWQRVPEAQLTVAGDGDLPHHSLLQDARVTVRHEHIPEEDTPALFANATCVVLPYRQASQSGVGSLAKRFGRPLVATSVGGLPELVSPGTGRLVPPEDPSALADALVELLRAPELAAEMARAAASSAVEDASWRRVAGLTLQAYERYLS